MRFLYDLNVLSLCLTKWFNLPCSNAYLVTQSVLPSRDIKHSLNINMSERKLTIISAFSVQIISYLKAYLSYLASYTELKELTGTVQVAYCLSYLLLTPCWDNHSSNVVLRAESGTLTLYMLTGSGFPSSIQTMKTMYIQRNPSHLTYLLTHKQHNL